MLHFFKMVGIYNYYAKSKHLIESNYNTVREKYVYLKILEFFQNLNPKNRDLNKFIVQ